MSGNRTGEGLRRLAAIAAVVLATVFFSLPSAGLLHFPHSAMHHASAADSAVAGTRTGEIAVAGHASDLPCCPAMQHGPGIDCTSACMAAPGTSAEVQAMLPPIAAGKIALRAPLRLAAHSRAPDHGPPRG